jgi:hypothetical protein
MTPSSGDIDYVIMTNAYEESQLAEVLSDYCRQHPNVGESEAQQLLLKRLSDLVREGKIGMYEVENGRTYQFGKEYRDLSTEETLAVILGRNNWVWAANDEAGGVIHCLFAKENRRQAPEAGYQTSEPNS